MNFKFSQNEMNATETEKKTHLFLNKQLNKNAMESISIYGETPLEHISNCDRKNLTN